jgi:hypothetical protein
MAREFFNSHQVMSSLLLVAIENMSTQYKKIDERIVYSLLDKI